MPDNSSEEINQVVVPHLLMKILTHLRADEQESFHNLINQLAEKDVNRSGLLLIFLGVLSHLEEKKEDRDLSKTINQTVQTPLEDSSQTKNQREWGGLELV